jgi:hypothetical protein
LGEDVAGKEGAYNRLAPVIVGTLASVEGIIRFEPLAIDFLSCIAFAGNFGENAMPGLGHKSLLLIATLGWSWD